jgi:hypothetical protein
MHKIDQTYMMQTLDLDIKGYLDKLNGDNDDDDDE